jgi:hypothetical protein
MNCNESVGCSERTHRYDIDIDVSSNFCRSLLELVHKHSRSRVLDSRKLKPQHVHRRSFAVGWKHVCARQIA